MKTMRSIGVCMALAAAAAGCADAYADDQRDPRRDYAKGAGSAEPSASAAPEPLALRDGGTPWAPTFETSFPEEESPAPTLAEWHRAPEARDARVTEPGCKAQRIREWYRIVCKTGVQIEMISGQHEGVSFDCAKVEPDSIGCDAPAVRFPARRGDRRAFQVLGWAKWGAEPNSFVTEQFIEGDPAPLVSVHGIHFGL